MLGVPFETGTQLSLYDHMDEGDGDASVRLASRRQPTHNVAVRVRLDAKREAPPSQMGPSRKEEACIGLIRWGACINLGWEGVRMSDRAYFRAYCN